jgi:hypothetical protein
MEITPKPSLWPLTLEIAVNIILPLLPHHYNILGIIPIHMLCKSKDRPGSLRLMGVLTTRTFGGRVRMSLLGVLGQI